MNIDKILLVMQMERIAAITKQTHTPILSLKQHWIISADKKILILQIFSPS